MAIDCMPRDTRRAMLDGITSNKIIVGAYTDRDGGVCPMLAAHRHGGRTALSSFARAWDRYTNAHGRPRPATDRELRMLKAMLEASVMWDDDRGELTAAVSELKAAKARRTSENGNGHRAWPEAGDRYRTPELRKRHGWSWLRVFRRYDAYQSALEQIEAAERDERNGNGNGAAERERELV